MVDAVAAEDFQSLLQRIGAGAGQPQTQDLERARAGPVGFGDGIDDVVERLHRWQRDQETGVGDQRCAKNALIRSRESL